MLKDTIAAMTRAKQIKPESYIYSAVFNTLAAGPAVQTAVNVQISNDSDFVILATTLVSYSAAGILVVAPDYSISLLDTSSGRQLQDVPVHVNNVTGTGQWPYVWPEPWQLAGGGTLQVTLTNNTAVAALVTVSFIGMKIFYMRGFTR